MVSVPVAAGLTASAFTGEGADGETPASGAASGLRGGMPVLSVVMREAGRMGLRPEGSNLCRGIRRYRRKGRERFLSDDEIRRLSAVLWDHALRCSDRSPSSAFFSSPGAARARYWRPAGRTTERATCSSATGRPGGRSARARRGHSGPGSIAFPREALRQPPSIRSDHLLAFPLRKRRAPP